MTLTKTLAILAAVLPVGAAFGQPAKRPPPPAALIKDATTFALQCAEAGGKTGSSPDMIKIADLTGDGVRDYVIDLNHYVCEGAASAMSAGQSGAEVRVYIGGPGNTARQVWIGLAFDTRLEGAPAKPRLWLTTEGLNCGQKNAATIPRSQIKGCVRPLDWDAGKGTFVYAPVTETKAQH